MMSNGVPEEGIELTQKQIQARIRMKQQVERLKRESEAQQKRIHFKESVSGDEEFAEDVKSANAPEVVYTPEEAPEGPPWRYDLTPAQQAERQIKKEQRGATRKRIKDSALEKTPKSLKNPSNLQVRFRTALVYTLATIACVIAGNISTLVYLMVVAGICAGEFFYMLRSDAKLPNEALGITGAVLYLPAVYFWGLQGAIIVGVVLLMALIVWYVFWLKSRVQDVAVSFFGAAYTGLLLSGLLIIRQSIDAPWAGLVLFLIFLSVWANDAFAYFVGSKIGKHKLAPRTSPKKSWEGFFAGLVGSALVWIVISFTPGISMPIWMAIVIGIVCGLAEVLGDLAESRIKRNSGFKDSGTIMPGHGGLLDRCDSLFLAAPTACALMLLFGCIPYAGF